MTKLGKGEIYEQLTEKAKRTPKVAFRPKNAEFLHFTPINMDFNTLFNRLKRKFFLNCNRLNKFLT